MLSASLIPPNGIPDDSKRRGQLLSPPVPFSAPRPSLSQFPEKKAKQKKRNQKRTNKQHSTNSIKAFDWYKSVKLIMSNQESIVCATWNAAQCFALSSVSKIYSLRDVERRPVLCSFKRIEGGLSKKSLKKIRLYILHSSAASLPSIRVPRPRKHPRVSRVALSARAC